MTPFQFDQNKAQDILSDNKIDCLSDDFKGAKRPMTTPAEEDEGGGDGDGRVHQFGQQLGEHARHLMCRSELGQEGSRVGGVEECGLLPDDVAHQLFL